MTKRVFLLSPAHCGGKRAQMLLRDGADFALARQLRDSGAQIGEVFAFISGLYFRGKLAYARAFGPTHSFVITTNSGLLPIDTLITREDLVEFGAVDIADDDPRYRRPLVRDAGKLDSAVLLGSIATAKYVEPLTEVLGERLLVPVEFAGRGDMSRGGLLLRHARAGRELTYAPVTATPRHGPRPPKLPRQGLG